MRHQCDLMSPLSLCFSSYLSPSSLHHFTFPTNQCAVVSWPREASLCVWANTSVLWTTSECTGLAASAARTSLREKWCPPWARPTTLAASSAPPAGKELNLTIWLGPLPITWQVTVAHILAMQLQLKLLLSNKAGYLTPVVSDPAFQTDHRLPIHSYALSLLLHIIQAKGKVRLFE